MMSTRKMIQMRQRLKYFCLGNQNTSHEENLSAQKCPFSCILQNPLSQCFDSVGRGQSCSRCIFLELISNQFPGRKIRIKRENLGQRKKKVSWEPCLAEIVTTGASKPCVTSSECTMIVSSLLYFFKDGMPKWTKNTTKRVN